MRIKYDNLFFTVLGKVMDVLWISLLWIAFSIPLITIGASSTALYYTIHKVVFNDEGYIFRTFSRSFIANFKKSTVKWIICIVLIGFLCVDILLVRGFAESGNVVASLIYPFLVILAFVVMCMFSIFAYSARFEDSIKNSLWKGAVITATNLGWMIFLLIILYLRYSFLIFKVHLRNSCN